MTAQTNAKHNDFLDVKAALDRLTEANRKAGNDYLDLVEKTVAQVTDLQLKTAAAIKLPVVVDVVEAQTTATREVAGTYVKTARDILNA